MIATLSGKLLFVFADKAVVDVGGVGYEAYLSHDSVSRLPAVGDDVFLHIHTHVREDVISLFGFLEEEQKEMFIILKSVSGIGPKLALSVLSGIRVKDLCLAISTKDIKVLTSLPGIGKKMAERLCLDLKDKVGHLSSVVAVSDEDLSGLVQASTYLVDALSALVNLGYPDPVARKALATVEKVVGKDAFNAYSVEDLIRMSLQSLAH